MIEVQSVQKVQKMNPWDLFVIKSCAVWPREFNFFQFIGKIKPKFNFSERKICFYILNREQKHSDEIKF